MAGIAVSASAAQVDIPGPAGSGAFGSSVLVLPNGNIVVTDPNASVGASNAGAVYLYSASGALISTLTGGRAFDRVGSGGIVVLSNGHFVVRSPLWNNGAAGRAGAVTWGNAHTGISGVVSPANSLVGATAGDSVGIPGVAALGSGDYVVMSAYWDNGASGANVGAATWVDGRTGVAGVVSSANSLIGTTRNDFEEVDVVELANGNYVVANGVWDHGTAMDAGAVTWANGGGGLQGQVSAANSLVGTTAGDRIGADGVTALSNGNYVVVSASWRNGAAVRAGAVTWLDGASPYSGEVSPSNSLIGIATDDRAGSGGVTELRSGHYVVSSPFWNHGAAVAAGAVTWANGSTGLSGAISAANSLVGATSDDRVGRAGSDRGITALANGHYVVASSLWDNGAATNVGAVTWADGDTGRRGVLLAEHALIGTTPDDQVGRNGVTALFDGHYVVRSSEWDNGPATNVGAVTWANGITGLTGAVSPSNSLIGSTADDAVGAGAVVPLRNGNYVVASPSWDHGPVVNAGAVTWVSGATPTSGVVSMANSLTGTSNGDSVGERGVVELVDGDYVVASSVWDHANSTDAGAVTWASGATGLVGAVSPANSLVGTRADDRVGHGGARAFRDGNFAVLSPHWDNGAVAEAGAVTLGRGNVALTGIVHANNSVLGTVPGTAAPLSFAYDPTLGQLVVGRPASNIVSLFTLPPDVMFGNGFE